MKMAFLTNISVFLKATIDNIYKFVYNIKCELFLIAVMALPAILCILLPFPAEASSAERAEPVRFVLKDTGHAADGEIVFEIALSEKRELCGMLATLRYDEASLEFVNCEIDKSLSEKGFVLSAHLRNGKVVLLLDGSENFEAETVARLVFKPKCGGEFGFLLTPISAFKWENGELCDLGTETIAESLVFSRDLSETAPQMSSARLDESESGRELTLFGSVSEGFAAGFDVCVVDLSSFESEAFSTVWVLDPKEGRVKSINCSLALSDGESLCVIVKPVAFVGRRTVTGKEKIYIIDGGELIY